MVEQIAEDPVLARTKIIAEAWDAAGLYQVGSFSPHPRWAEWNGRFRDDVRSFMCGHGDTVSALATRMAGSSDLYQSSSRHPFNSINFVTSHDGFTLYDLVSYNRKHNLRNGEDDRDGDNHNISWNSGVEGETDHAEIRKLRIRRIKTFAMILFLSQGTPMLVAGDEFGRSQQGNNNAYCQDNEISWLDWRLAEKNGELLRFFRLLISLRKNHRVFRRCDFFREEHFFDEIRWQSFTPGRQDWSPDCHALGFFLDGRAVAGKRDDDFFVMLNGGDSKALFTTPEAAPGRSWCLIVDTASESPDDFVEENQAEVVRKKQISVSPMGGVVLIGK
jgi:glycogen operon protein